MKFVRNSYEIRTNFVRISVNFVQFAPFALPLPRVHSPFLNFCLAHLPTSACRSRSPLGRRIFGTTPGASTSPSPDCLRSTPSPPKAPVAPSPQAPAVDGHQARPAVCAVWGRSALGVREAARPAPPGGIWRARWWCPSRPATRWARPTPTPPWTGSPWPPGSRIPPGPSRCRPGRMGGSGTSVPCGTWSWSRGGCRAPSASPSSAPLCSGGGPTCLRGRSWWACLPTGL